MALCPIEINIISTIGRADFKMKCNVNRRHILATVLLCFPHFFYNRTSPLKDTRIEPYWQWLPITKRLPNNGGILRYITVPPLSGEFTHLVV